MNTTETKNNAIYETNHFQPYFATVKSLNSLKISSVKNEIASLQADDNLIVEKPEQNISKIPPDTCLVCGDPTKCCHYDVPSCSGCKTFFRRTVISGKNFACSGSGQCNIKGKNSCRQCRFDKCVIVGMNPAAIKLPQNVNLDDLITRVQSRKRTILKHAEYRSSINETENMSIVPVKMASIRLPEIMEFRDVDYMLFLEIKVQKLRESEYHPQFQFSSTFRSVIDRRTELSNVDHYKTIGSNWQQPIFNMAVKNDGNFCHKNGKRKKMWLAVDIFLSIELSKTLPVFEMLKYDDKEAFVRNAVLPSAVLTQSYYSYENHSNILVFPDGCVPLIRWKNHNTGELTKLVSEIFVRIVQPVQRINLTKEEYALLKAIVLCNPACKNISDEGQKLLTKASERYSRTLLRYIQSVHGEAKGASRFAQVIGIMEAMTYFAERNREFHVILMIKLQSKMFFKRCTNSIFDEIMENS